MLNLLLPTPLALGTKAMESALTLGPSATEGQSQARWRHQRLPLPLLASRLAPWPPSSAHRPATLQWIMDPKEKPEATSGPPPPPRLDCIKCFDMLWFCYSPFHQMQNYYRFGEFDNCFGKWADLVDCLTLKTKRAAEVEEILIAREKAKPHIWTYRTVDEASENWWRMYKHFVVLSPPVSDSAQFPPKSDKSWSIFPWS